MAAAAARDGRFDAALAQAVAGMRPGWVALRDRAPAGDGAAPAGQVGYALLHPEVGIALLDVVPGPAAPGAADRLRRALDAGGFAAAHGGLPPIVHLWMPARALGELEAALDQEFARRPSPAPDGGAAWVAAARRVLAGRQLRCPAGQGQGQAGGGAVAGGPPSPARGRGSVGGGRRDAAVGGGTRLLVAFWGLLALAFGGGVLALQVAGPPGVQAVADGGGGLATARLGPGDRAAGHAAVPGAPIDGRRDVAPPSTGVLASWVWEEATAEPATATAPEHRDAADPRPVLADGDASPRAAEAGPSSPRAARVLAAADGPSPGALDVSAPPHTAAPPLPLPGSATDPSSSAGSLGERAGAGRTESAAPPAIAVARPAVHGDDGGAGFADARPDPGPSPATGAPAARDGDGRTAAAGTPAAAATAPDTPNVDVFKDAAASGPDPWGGTPPAAVVRTEGAPAEAAFDTAAGASVAAPVPDGGDAAPASFVTELDPASPPYPNDSPRARTAAPAAAEGQREQAPQGHEQARSAALPAAPGAAAATPAGGPSDAPGARAADAWAKRTRASAAPEMPPGWPEPATAATGGTTGPAAEPHAGATTAVGTAHHPAFLAGVGAWGARGGPDAALFRHLRAVALGDSAAREALARAILLPSGADQTATPWPADGFPGLVGTSGATTPLIGAEATPAGPMGPPSPPPPRDAAAPAPSSAADPWAAGPRAPSGIAGAAGPAQRRRQSPAGAAAGAVPGTAAGAPPPPAMDGRCRVIALKAQLGEELHQADRSFLRAGCRRGPA